ncbi:hypothetical protein OF83DRAFT_1180896 [Amylostereum chailletii]|nr:hypothetical protein OF83DRAFT_1180896 [Amylostereum chailletii]
MPESTPPPPLRRTITSRKELQQRRHQHKIRQALKASYLTARLLGHTIIASESSPRATTPDFPLGFTRGANPGEYYALTLVTAQWYFNDEEGFPYVEQTDIDVAAQEHDRTYNPQTPKQEEVATAPQEEGSPPPPPRRDQPWSVPLGIRFDERTKKWYAYKKNGRAVVEWYSSFYDADIDRWTWATGEKPFLLLRTCS